MELWKPGDPIAQAPQVQRLLNKPAQLQPRHVMKLWRAKPVIFVKDQFDATPDTWQEEAYDAYMRKQRVGMIANKGPGKTWTLATLGWHFFICHHMVKLAALAITKDHLKANLWAELAKLHAQSKLLSLSVEPGSERFTLKGHDLYSFIDARSFPKQADNNQMASALAGLHADNVGFLLDEAGMIPDSVIATADNALSGGEGPMMKKRILAAGNPEQPSGLIYRASKGESEQDWAIIRVTGDPDAPNRSKRVDVAWAREQIKTYGKDDPWVQINVFGEYPKTAVETVLSDEEVSQAMKRSYDDREVKNSQHRLGLDVSRGGVDRTVFARRRGLKAYPLEVFASDQTGPQLASRAASMQRDLGIEKIFVDNTGGYGSSVIDSLNVQFPEIDVVGVIYNSSADRKEIYLNKRTEMWMRLRDWVRGGGALPNDPELAADLAAPKVIRHNGVTRLESKEEIKKRLGRSPDRGDALAQTFAIVEQASFNADYNPLRPDGSMKSYDEIVNEWIDKGMRQGRDLVGHHSQIDNRYRPSPNHIS